jgi:hypothetical protein
MRRFKGQGSAARFLTVHAAVYNIFNVQCHLVSARTHRSFEPQPPAENSRAAASLRCPSGNLTEPVKILLQHRAHGVLAGQASLIDSPLMIALPF